MAAVLRLSLQAPTALRMSAASSAMQPLRVTYRFSRGPALPSVRAVSTLPGAVPTPDSPSATDPNAALEAAINVPDVWGSQLIVLSHI